MNAQTKPEEGRYFGVPGHCISIDGDLWHDPGKCIGTPANCSGDCCGFEPTAAELEAAGQATLFGGAV